MQYYTPIATQRDKEAMEAVVPQAYCLHRKYDRGRRDACGTCMPSRNRIQWPQAGLPERVLLNAT